MACDVRLVAINDMMEAYSIPAFVTHLHEKVNVESVTGYCEFRAPADHDRDNVQGLIEKIFDECVFGFNPDDLVFSDFTTHNGDDAEIVVHLGYTREQDMFPCPVEIDGYLV